MNNYLEALDRIGLCLGATRKNPLGVVTTPSLVGRARLMAISCTFFLQFDEALVERNTYYRRYRKAGTVCQPLVYLVKPGTFKALRNFIIENSTASFNQFKMPRKLKTSATLELMLDNRLISKGCRY